MEISLAGWSIHRRFRDEDNPLQLLDYPRLSVEDFSQLKDAQEAVLKDMAHRYLDLDVGERT